MDLQRFPCWLGLLRVQASAFGLWRGGKDNVGTYFPWFLCRRLAKASPLWVRQLILDRAAVTAFAQVTTDPSLRTAAKAPSEACICCTFFS